MLESARKFVASHNDVSQLVREARSFSVNVPVVGKVSVPPPNQLAFYGVLAVLGVTELIPWPVAVGLGVGHALTTRYATETAAQAATEAVEEAAAAAEAPARKTPAKKAAAKTPAKKAAASKAPAKRPGQRG